MGSKIDEKIFRLYKRKRVLVTGDTGFKGSWLSLWLHELGARVVGYALPPAQKLNHFSLLRLDRKIRHINGDIRDFTRLRKLFLDFQPEFLFHLAAQPIVRISYKEPKLTFDTNVGGFVNALEAARITPSLKVAIFVTSDKCYKNEERVQGYREHDELGGHDPYGASKASAELAFAAYQTSFFNGRDRLGSASVRAGNVIGGGDWSPDRILPDCIRSLEKREPIVLRNPNATRPWQHVLEPLYAYLFLGAKLYHEPKRYSSSWNFAPDSESVHTVKDLARKVLKYWGEGQIKLANSRKKELPEDKILQLNCDKAHRLLGWYPRWDFDRAVSETVRWYKKVAGDKPALAMTRGQIRNYMES